MNAHQFFSLILLSLLSAAGCSQKQTETERRQFEEVKARAEQGEAPVQYYLGLSYASGAYGLTKDYGEAVKWYRKAAEQGHAGGQYELGRAYYNGNGVAQDCDEGVKLYRQAANQGQPSAQYILGVCYWNGVYVPRNYAEAHKWISLAVAQGEKGSPQALHNLEKLMTKEEVAEARRLASEFIPRKTR